MLPPEKPPSSYSFGSNAPSLVLLADDEGLAGFALGVERVEVLLQPLLGGSCGCRSRSEVLPGHERRSPQID